MADPFFDHPILNSPYAYPTRHWELDPQGQPTQKINEFRRRADFITPIPKPRKQKGKQSTPAQGALDLYSNTEGESLSSDDQKYDSMTLINAVRDHVDTWRRLPDPSNWKVTPETARLLQHWRGTGGSFYNFTGIRPFFCQIEAVETLIWLTEVVPALGRKETALLDFVKDANTTANPELFRIALKMATGSGKTTVMAMIIAWQTINAVRRPQSKRFTKGFLVVTPGITIRDRLRVLQPTDPDSYYESRGLVPQDMLQDIKKAKIVITNYHAFMLREKMNLAKGTRSLLQGAGDAINTAETEGQMIHRVMPELMNIKNVLVINDEAHHCYREKASDESELLLKGDEKEEANENNEAARVWITGLEMVKHYLGINTVVDLSATPFFLRGSGYAEGTLFHWTVSDFSLMDAIECGIVKLPRVPVSDNIPGEEAPKYRNLWEHIGPRMPKKSRAHSGALDPMLLPRELYTALEALYGHYEKTFTLWKAANITVPPCFIIVCNNTASSKLIYDYVSGFYRENEKGERNLEMGRLPLFSNFDEDGNPLGRPHTLLIDSQQLESGDSLDDTFRFAAKDEIERFRSEIVQRTGNRVEAAAITDQELLREVMNTVGKQDRLGDSIRCVVSVSMLTEGWDANTVTHVLGVRAFGTQLLCEQVIGRALRRQSYDLNEAGLFNVEYADVLGIPFDFTAKPQIVEPKPPRETISVRAVSPERDSLEIRFPRVAGYRAELPREHLKAQFTKDSEYVLTPSIVGPTKVQTAGIIGETADLDVKHLDAVRPAAICYKLTQRLLETKFRDSNEEIRYHLFGDLKKITAEWLDTYLICKGGVYPAMLLYQELADEACNRIEAAISRYFIGEKQKPIKALLDPYNPEGSTIHVNFTTSKTTRWQTDSRKCHINWVITDSDWESEFCRVVEAHPAVLAYVKNQGLGFEVPYRFGSQNHTYFPDFIVVLDDGHGKDDPLHLIVEIKGFRKEDAKEKKLTMESFWVPGVNRLAVYGRWGFAEFRYVYDIEEDFAKVVGKYFGGGYSNGN
ncbi:restriction endonuclease [Spirochaetia bacterium]|nr:restriction endonuclease [Spirochaetia bacterium]